MDNHDNWSKEVDEYIAEFPVDVQKVTEKLRKIIHEAAPQAQETFLCQLPTFKLNGHVIQFALHKEHIMFYPSAAGLEMFKNDLAKYEGAGGTVIFPLDKPIPFDVIKEIVAYRLRK